MPPQSGHTQDRPDVLFVTRGPISPNGRGHYGRSFHLLRQLSRAASVHLACPSGRPGGESILTPLRRLCVRASLANCRRERLDTLRPAGEAASWGRRPTRPSLRELVRAWAHETRFHAVVVAARGTALSLPMPALRGVPLLLDVSGLPAPPPSGGLSQVQHRRLLALGRLGAKARAVTLSTEAEVDLFRRYCPYGELLWVAGGVDILQYEPPRLAPDGSDCLLLGDGGCGVGAEEAVRFCREVWPAVRERRPGACLRVALWDFPAGVEPADLPGAQLLRKPTDFRAELASAAVVLAPLRGAGASAGILEALAMGKPLVASDDALAVLANRLDAPALVAGPADEWVAHVTRLLEDRSLRAQLGHAGRLYAEAHEWGRCLQPVLNLLDLPAAGAESPPPLPSRTALVSDRALGRR